MEDLEKALAIHDRSLTITGTTLPGSGLDKALTAFNAGLPLVIAEAEPKPGPNLVGVVGRTTFAKVSGTVSAEFSLDAAGNPRALIRMELPESWAFSQSFPDPTDKGAAREELDELRLAGAALVFSSQEAPDPSGATLEAGLNVVGRLHLEPLAGFLPPALAGGATATFQARVTPALGAAPPPLPVDASPWDTLGWTVPGIVAQAKLDFELTHGEAKLDDVRLHFYSPPSTEWEKSNTSYWPAQGLSAHFGFDQAGINARLSGVMVPGGNTATISAAITGASFGKLDDLAGLAPGQSFRRDLPQKVEAMIDAIEELTVTEAVVEFSGELSVSAVSLLGVTIGFPAGSWEPVPGFVPQISTVQFLVVEPFGGSAQVSAVVGGTLKVGGQPLEITTELPSLTVRAQLPPAEDATVASTDLARDHAPKLSLPALSIDQLSFYVEPGKAWSVEATMADEPPWQFDVGPHQLTIADVELALSKEAEADPEGSISGLLLLDDQFAVEAQYGLPGELMVRAELQQIRLTQLIKLLDEADVLLPDDFDLTFEQAYLLLDRDATGQRFTAATRIKGVGLAAFTAQRGTDGKTGVALGLELTQPASTLNGLGELAKLESLVGLTDLMLVVSSLAQSGFQLPAMSSFGAPALEGAQLQLPPQAKGLVPGLNVYGKLSATNSKGLQSLANWLGIKLDGTATVTLGVSLPDPTKESKLQVGVDVTVDGVGVKGELGLWMHEHLPTVLLDAEAVAKIGSHPVKFHVEASLLTDGVMVTSTTTETLTFGGVNISDVALVVGLDFEGVPSLGFAGIFDVPEAKFDGSLAIFLDSVEPAKSMLAGSVSSASELTVASAVKALAPSLAMPEAIEGALARIGVKGLAAFSLPASRAAALDNRDLAMISAAFQQYGSVALPSASDRILLVVSEQGKEWHLTDLSTMTHYSLLAGELGIEVSLDAQVYIAPQKMWIGGQGSGIPIEKGFHVEGVLDLLVTEVRTRVEITEAGILADVDADPIELGDGILKLTDAAGKGGPRLSLATFSRPGQEAPFDKPHFLLSGHLDVLGFEVAAAEIEIDSKGLRVSEATVAVVPGVVKVTLAGEVTDAENLLLSGGASVGVNTTIELGELGKLPLDDQVGGTVTVALVAGSGSVTFAGSLIFQKEEIAVPSFKLPIEAGVLTRLGGLVEDELEALLKQHLIENAKVWLAWVKSGAIQGISKAATIGHVLGHLLHQTEEEVASLMREAGYAIADIAGALCQGLELGAQRIIEALIGAGYAIEAALPEIAAALHALGEAAPALARALISLKVATEAVARVLQTAYSMAGEAVGKLFHEIGVAAAEIGAALRNVFEMGVEAVGNFFKNVFEMGAEELEEVLEDAGFALEEIQGWFESVGLWNPEEWRG